MNPRRIRVECDEEYGMAVTLLPEPETAVAEKARAEEVK